MLRSVVSAVAAKMMLVQCNCDVPISLACLILIGNSPERRCPLMVCNANHERGHHRNRVPGGTSKACVQAGDGWELGSSGRIGHCDIGPEVGVINPHAVKDHCDTTCQGDHGAFCATAPGKMRGLCSQPR